MLEGSVAEDFSHLQNRKFCCILHIHEYHVPQEKDDSTGKIERSIV